MVKWIFSDTKRAVRKLTTDRTIINVDNTIIRFNSIEKIPEHLKRHITCNDDKIVVKVIYGNMIWKSHSIHTITRIEDVMCFVNRLGEKAFFATSLINELDGSLSNGMFKTHNIFVKYNSSMLFFELDEYFYGVCPVKEAGVNPEFNEIYSESILDYGLIDINTIPPLVNKYV